jgi:hypothetical protein
MTYHIGTISNYWKSVIWELVTGYDSIRTIGAMYSRGENRTGGAHQCVFPDCGYARYDSEDMWNHVHFSRKHDPGGQHAAEYVRFLKFLYEGGEPLSTFE